MDRALIFALLTMITNACYDLVYRKSSLLNNNSKDIYSFYFYASFFSAFFAFILNIVMYKGIAIDSLNLKYGLLLGILSYLTYMFYILSFSQKNTSISVTIYRLHMIPAVIFAIIFFNESISIKRVLGIIICILSILLFTITKDTSNNKGDIKSLMYSTGACICGAILDMINKLAVMNGASTFKLLLCRYAVVSLIALLIMLVRKCDILINKNNFKYALISGFLMVIALCFALEALRIGDVSLVLPVTQMSFILVAIISVIFYKERMDRKKILGIILSIIAIFLIS
ncbi:MAG: EamA family transporter [Clostridia bacterium]|nr:EamA family transporter [Clostridia bacterium]